MEPPLPITPPEPCPPEPVIPPPKGRPPPPSQAPIARTVSVSGNENEAKKRRPSSDNIDLNDAPFRRPAKAKRRRKQRAHEARKASFAAENALSSRWDGVRCGVWCRQDRERTTWAPVLRHRVGRP